MCGSDSDFLAALEGDKKEENPDHKQPGEHKTMPTKKEGETEAEYDERIAIERELVEAELVYA